MGPSVRSVVPLRMCSTVRRRSSVCDASFSASQSTLSSRLADLRTRLSSLVSIVIRLLLVIVFMVTRDGPSALFSHHRQQASQCLHAVTELCRRRCHQGAIAQTTVEQRQQHGTHLGRI